MKNNIIGIFIDLFLIMIVVIVGIKAIFPAFSAIKTFAIAYGIMMLIETIVVSVTFYKVLKNK